MLAQLYKFVLPPRFVDEEQTRRAGVLHAILLTLLVVMGGALLASTAMSMTPAITASIGLVLELLFIGLLELNRRGYVRQVGVWLAFCVWGAVTVSVGVRGGVYASPTLAGYVVVIVIAGLLLGGRAAVGFAGLCSLSLVALFLAEAHHLFAPLSDPNPVLSSLAIYFVIFFTTALLVRLASKSLKDALAQARLNEQTQREINQQLEELRASLETRVSDRTTELMHRTVQMEISEQVGQQITSILDLDELLALVVNLLQVRFGYYFVGVWLVDEAGREVSLRTGVQVNGQGLVGMVPRRALTYPSLVTNVCRTGQRRLVNDISTAPDYWADARLPEVLSELVLPLRMGDSILGALDVQSERREAFNLGDAIVLQSLADQLAVAIRNASLYQAELQRRHSAETLSRASRMMTSDLDIQQMPGRILDGLGMLVPYTHAALLLRQEVQVQVQAQRGFTAEATLPHQPLPIQPGDAFQQLMLTRQPFLAAEVSLPADWWPAQATEPVWLGLPILAQERAIGMILATRQQGNFSPDEVTLAMTLAGQAGIALENASLYQAILQFNQHLEQLVQQRTEELNQAYQRLEQLDKAKLDFITVTAHELRTPLTLLKGYTQILLDMLSRHPEALPLLQGILVGEERLLEIVNRMLDMTKLDTAMLSLHFQPTKLALVIEHCRKEFASAMRERGLQFVAVNIERLPLIMADNDLLSKAFHHLIVNAIKYTPDGGSITVSGRLVQETDQPIVEVIVQDTGIGIDLHHQDLVFEKFYQITSSAIHSSGRTSFKGGGPGLGLSIARGIVRAHGGRIWVESPGHDEQTFPGSQFHVCLPINQPH